MAKLALSELLEKIEKELMAEYSRCKNEEAPDHECCRKSKEAEEAYESHLMAEEKALENDKKAKCENDADEEELEEEKDIYIPIPCEGTLCNLKATYQKKNRVMDILILTKYNDDGVKVVNEQHVVVDCGDVEIDTNSLDVHFDDLGAVVFSANVLKDEEPDKEVLRIV